MILRKVAATVAVAALAAVGAIAAVPAMADTVKYDSWIEDDDQTPVSVTGALVFYKDASINFGHGTAAVHASLVPLAEVDGLAYTVAESSSSTPSYQVAVVSKIKNVTYARLVWVPKAGENIGVHADLEDGLWWANNVWVGTTKTQPFLDKAGSQGSPQPLTFFKSHFGTDAQVDFFGLTQGSGNELAATVTSLTFGGRNVPLGTVDDTPFNSKDVDAAVAKATAPLTAQLATLKAEFEAYKLSHPFTTEGGREGYVNTADAAKAKWKLVDLASQVAAQNDAATAKAKIVSISGTEKVGKTVSAKIETIAGSTRSYQWYAATHSVKGATHSTFKLSSSRAKHSLYVTVTTSWTDANGAAHSVKATAKYLRTAYVAR